MAERGALSGQILGEKYLLEELLGKGGFAEVYKAQNQLLKRPQAIKVLLEHHISNPKFRERFTKEAQVLGGLEHPNIMVLHDFGFEENRAYLVMPYISRGTLQKVLEDQAGPLTIAQTYSLVQPIFAALEYAHAHNVVHLDLKPLNVLLHQDGRLLLSDFGLAHLMSQEKVEGGASLQLGTPHYMAPEHWKGQPGKSSDIYSLGVMLYRMLVGKEPFNAESPWALGVKHMTASPPSLCDQVASIPPELEEVIFIALAKDPKDRFATIRAFANAFNQAGKAALKTARNAVSVASMPQSSANSPARSLDEVAEKLRTWSESIPLTGAPRPLTHPAQSLDEVAERLRMWSEQVDRPESALLFAPTQLISNPLEKQHGSYSADVLNAETVVSKDSPLPTLPKQSEGRALPLVIKEPGARNQVTFRNHSKPVQSVVWSPDGQRIASASTDQTVQVWDAADGGNIFTYRGHVAEVQAVAWSPEGQWIASASSDQTVQIWEAATRHSSWDITKERRVATHRCPGGSQVFALAWSPSGQVLAAGTKRQGVQLLDLASRSPILGVRLLDLASRSPILTYRGHHYGKVFAVDWSPDGQWIASAGDDQMVHVWKAATAGRVCMYRGHEGSITTLAWSPDGRHIASGSLDGKVHIWESATGTLRSIFVCRFPYVRTVAWSPDGGWIGAGSFRDIEVWKVTEGKRVCIYHGHTKEVLSLAWSPTDQRIVSGGQDCTVQVWDTSHEEHQAE